MFNSNRTIFIMSVDRHIGGDLNKVRRAQGRMAGI